MGWGAGGWGGGAWGLGGGRGGGGGGGGIFSVGHKYEFNHFLSAGKVM